MPPAFDRSDLKEMEADEALQVIRLGNRLVGMDVRGRLDLSSIGDPMEDVTFPVNISNCDFDEYYSPLVWYRAPVEFVGCTFKNADIHAVYFIKGLVCRDTEWLSEICWDFGGHNHSPILFERVKFHKFVDFFDCWFKGPVVLRNVEFLEGTNLLNPDHGWVGFEAPPILEEVRGRVDSGLNLGWKDGSMVLTDRSPRFLRQDSKR